MLYNAIYYIIIEKLNEKEDLNMYELIETKNNDISSYGIKCGNVRIEDISTKKNTVERLVSMANQYDLSPIHLHDFVEDFVENI